MEEYKKHIIKLIENTPIQNDDVFFYNGMPLEEEFGEVFNLYSKTLANNSHYGITPVYFYFNNITTSNARATKIGENYLIEFNKGLIYNLTEKFLTKPDLFEDYKGLVNVELNALVYQSALHFTFYHELGHLVQKSELLDQGLREEYMYNSSYSERRHILELDADEFSAINLAAHISQLARNSFSDKMTSDELARLVVVLTCGILFHILYFKTFNTEFYLEEHEHPHPLIRITEIIFVLITHTESTLNQNGINVTLNPNEIVRQTMVLANRISHIIGDKQTVSNFQELLEKNETPIRAYLEKMKEIRRKDSSLSVKKWNVMAEKMHGRIIG